MLNYASFSLIRVSKSHPCEICLGDHGCSYDPNSTVRLCVRLRGDTEDFKFSKEAGAFGVYYPRHSKGTSFARRAVQRQAASNPDDFIIKLPHLELAKHLTKVFALENGNVYLTQQHRESLLARGLTLSQIEEFGYFSLYKNLKVETADKHCPGFSSKGYFCQASSIAIPIRNMDNQILGYQLRMDRGDDRYKWAKGYDQERSNPTNTSKIQIGDTTEYPVTFCSSKNSISTTLYLSEGVLKPQIASAKLGLNVAGAMSGFFHQSPKQVNEILERFKPDCVIFLADVASLTNEHVYNNILKQIDFLAGLPASSSFDGTVYVADWGQLEAAKGSKLDCDEITLSHFMRNRQLLNREEFVKRRRKLIPVELHDTTLPILQDILKFFEKDPSVRVGNKKIHTSYLKKKSLVPFFSGINSKTSCAKSTLTFKCEDRKLVYQKAVASDSKYILDISGTGSGKSYQTGLFSPLDFIMPSGLVPDRIFHATQQHRNPTTETLEDNYVAMPTKHNGLYMHPTKKTPRGMPVYMRSPQGSDVKLAANCSYYDRQQMMTDSQIKRSFCKKCPLVAKCSTEVVLGSHGYLYEKLLALLENDRLRVNITAMNKKDIGDNSLLIVDEVSKAIKFTESLVIDTLSLQRIKKHCQQFGQRSAVEAINVLIRFMSDPTLRTGNQVKYGFTRAEFVGLTNICDASFVHVAQAVGEKEQELNNLALDQGNSPIPEIGYALFRALSGVDSDYSFHITTNKIEIVQRNHKVLETLAAFPKVIMQDATMTRELMAAYLDCDPGEILLISEEDPEGLNSNVLVYQITALGAMTSIRTSETRKKQELTKKSLGLKRGTGKYGIGFIDKKAYAGDGDLIHHSDARGSNAFQHKNAICVFGLPFPSVSAAQMEFEVIYGVRFDAETAPQFDRFYTTKVQSEILQEIGRLRAGRRRNQPLDLYITATEDLSFLEEHGLRVLQISGYEIHPDLDNDRDRIIRSFISGEIDLDYSKMSVRKLSAQTGISKSSIGRYLSQEGFFDGVPLENLPKTIGERVAALVENVKADPEYLAYYLGTVLKNTKDPAARELVKSTTLKILAMNKQQIKKFKRLDSINQAAIAARALAMGIELTSYDVASIEKTLI